MELIKILDMGQGYLFEVKIKSKGVHAHSTLVDNKTELELVLTMVNMKLVEYTIEHKQKYLNQVQPVK